MKTIGKVHKVDVLMEGQTENGAWCRRTLVIETADERGRKIAVEFGNREKCEAMSSLQVGQMVEVGWIPDSREYEGKWYTRLSGIYYTAYQQA